MRTTPRAALPARLLRLALAYSLLSPPSALAAYAAGTAAALSKWHAAAARPLPAAQQGVVPAANLPNLDEIRQQRPAEPEAPPPAPSTLCSPLTPDCPPSN